MDSVDKTISAPPESTYASYEEAYNALRDHDIQYGYGYLLHLSRPHRSATKTHFYYRCDRYRNYESKATIRKTSTRTTGCPFSLVIAQKDDQ
jgi:hypothetical protein